MVFRLAARGRAKAGEFYECAWPSARPPIFILNPIRFDKYSVPEYTHVDMQSGANVNCEP